MHGNNLFWNTSLSFTVDGILIQNIGLIKSLDALISNVFFRKGQIFVPK